MSYYTLPQRLEKETITFFSHVTSFLKGDLDEITFKTFRVPFGIYEQRQKGTYMLRIRVSAGRITLSQFRGIIEIAKEYAPEKLHVTTRGDIQLHGLIAQNFIPVITALHALNLSSRAGGGNTIRNMTADIFSGVAHDSVFDVVPYVHALTQRLLEENDSYNLPRKFKLAFSASVADRADAFLADLGFIATRHNNRQGFKVYSGGGMGAKPRLGEVLFDFIETHELYSVVSAVKRVYDRHGNRVNRHSNRLRFLIEDVGLGTFKEWVEKEKESLESEPLTLLAYEEEYFKGEGLPVKRTPQGFPLWFNRFVSEEKNEGYYTIKIPLIQGDFDNDHALALVNALAPLGENVIGLGYDQNLYLYHIPYHWLHGLFQFIKILSPLTQQPTIIGDIVSCTGASTCQLGITLTRPLSEAIQERLKHSPLTLDSLDELKIHISGCPNSCGRHWVGDLGFYGKVSRLHEQSYPSYAIVAGSRRQESLRFCIKIGDIPARYVPEFVEKALHEWLLHKSSYESFADWIDDKGQETLSALASHLSLKAHIDPSIFYDWGAKREFSLKERGKGECTAGMYDLIEGDKKRIESLLHHEEKEKIYELLLYTTRMLLITRGIESREQQGVFDSFETYFIDGILVDKSYKSLIHKAKSGHMSDDDYADVVKLAQRILRLYSSMDYTLKFHVETIKDVA